MSVTNIFLGLLKAGYLPLLYPVSQYEYAMLLRVLWPLISLPGSQFVIAMNICSIY